MAAGTGWTSDEQRPVEALPGYRQLVHPSWLQDILDGARPEAPPTGRFLLFHVNFGVPEEYAESHLPGAVYLDTNWLEDPADWNRRPPSRRSWRSYERSSVPVTTWTLSPPRSPGRLGTSRRGSMIESRTGTPR